ncbi:MAG: DUF1844 domain-containing protein [Deltaproteobacteria bacterium]|nr:DUF1844 domain-containing protein [Deltaproteobacteria bacterium]
MSEEKKDFVVKDSRSLDEDGNPRDKTPEEEPEKKPVDKKQTAGTPPLPEADFTSLIFSLSSTALFHIGDIADPETGKKTVDMSLAKHAIDTISMLQGKTSGNLSGEEKKFTESVLADLRWRFVKAGK